MPLLLRGAPDYIASMKGEYCFDKKDPEDLRELQGLIFYGYTLLIVRGKGIASRMCSIPHSQAVTRSTPMPNPE